MCHPWLFLLASASQLQRGRGDENLMERVLRMFWCWWKNTLEILWCWWKNTLMIVQCWWKNTLGIFWYWWKNTDHYLRIRWMHISACTKPTHLARTPVLHSLTKLSETFFNIGDFKIYCGFEHPTSLTLSLIVTINTPKTNKWTTFKNHLIFDPMYNLHWSGL